MRNMDHVKWVRTVVLKLGTVDPWGAARWILGATDFIFYEILRFFKDFMLSNIRKLTKTI